MDRLSPIQVQNPYAKQLTIIVPMRNEKLVAALAACLSLVLFLVFAWVSKGAAQNLWWVALLAILLGPLAFGGYVITFLIVGYLSRKLKMDGFLFCVAASAVLGSLVFTLPSGFGFLTAFSRGHFNPKLMQWGMERALMVFGAMGGAIGGVAFYVTKQISTSKAGRSVQSRRP
jgi:hypothetical protein